MKHFLAKFCNLLVHHFWIFNPELVGCFVKIIRNDQRPNLFRHLLKNPMGKKEPINFLPVINHMQCLILYSYQNDDCWMNGNYCDESKIVEIPVDQIGQNTKNELLQHKISHTQCLRRASRHWWKEAKVISLRVFLSTTESCMIITNIFKTIILKE